MRILRPIFLLLSLCMSASAFADAPTLQTRWELSGELSVNGPAPEPLCSSWRAREGRFPASNFSDSYRDADAYSCGYTSVSGGVLDSVALFVRATRSLCEGGAPPDLSKPLNAQCGAAPPCVAGNKQQFAVTSEHLPASVCKDFCTWTESGNTAIQVEGIWYSSYTSTASSCTTNTPLLPSEPKQCPKGTHNFSNDPNNLDCKADDPTPPSCWAGSTNISTDPSIAICIDNSPPTPEEPMPQGPPTKKTDITGQKNPDGTTTTTTTETTTQKMSDGTTTITKKITQTTTNLDGTTTTKVTDAGAQGGGGGGNSDGLCRDNPNLTICRESSVGNGNCSPEGIDSTTCDGDPITCAMLKQQKKEYCEDHKADPIRTLGQQILGGNDPKKDTFPTIENAREVPFPTTLDQNGFLGGGACFPDFQFSVSNRSFTIPFSKLCDYLIALRGLVMLLATLASWRLISKSVLG